LGKHWDELKGREGEVMEFDPTQGIREAREEEERRSKVIKPRMLGDDHEYKVGTYYVGPAGVGWPCKHVLPACPGLSAASVTSSA
jgi:hypothetical protein